MTDKWIYKNKFFVPFSLRIFLILHPEETSDWNIIVVDYLFEPFGIHDYDFLTGLIYDFFLFDIFKWSSSNCCEYALGDNYSLNFYIFFNG